MDSEHRYVSGRNNEGRKIVWRTPFAENLVTFFRRAIGGLFFMSFALTILLKMHLLKGINPEMGVIIWILSPIPIGLYFGRPRTYIFDLDKYTLEGPGISKCIPLEEVSRYQVPSEDRDIIVGWGLQYLFAVIAHGFFMAPFFRGKFHVLLKNGSEETIHFARHQSALSFFTFFQAQLENSRNHG